MHSGLRRRLERQIKPATVRQVRLGFWPRTNCFSVTLCPSMHELNSDCVSLSPAWLTSSWNLPLCCYHLFSISGEMRQAHSRAFQPICMENNLTLSLLSRWNVRFALGEQCGWSMAFLCWFRRWRQMRGFCRRSDSSANTATPRPDMHFHSGQMSAVCGLWRQARVWRR